MNRETRRLAKTISRKMYGPDKNWFYCEPEPEDRMHGSYWRYTPCEVLRHTFQELEKPNPDIKEVKQLIRVATSMTKSLARRLTVFEGRGWGRKIYPMTPWWEAGKPGCVMPTRRG